MGKQKGLLGAVAMAFIPLLAQASSTASQQDQISYLPCEADISRLLALVNHHRTQGMRCGDQQLPAVPALSLDSRLSFAAALHAYDMASYNFLSHTGRDGRDVGFRVSSYGYPWQWVGENIAAGQPKVEVAVKEWLASDEHCANLMSPDYQQTGFACVVGSESDYRYYWVQVFATPQSKRQ
ncbi:CAP domain-containing protein [Ferrimonas aestuarii]|uniref:CAP domain-containing protein n=1 Tax=Ferrimonas aestuarii TaxID=2569539 RepID=A0A4U1BNW5_9GAMM|nr:CAP domain-containing protein [Ferrimonas aestuarii]TKB56031.1 CAP domain-containing protein [Ferrimonas aestuarii]